MEDYLDRLMAMAVPGQQTWDLSENDVKAVAWAVKEIKSLRDGFIEVEQQRYVFRRELAEAKEELARAEGVTRTTVEVLETRIGDLAQARQDLDAARAEAGRLREVLSRACGALIEASSVMQSFDPMTMTTASLRYMAGNCRLTAEHYSKLALATPAADASRFSNPNACQNCGDDDWFEVMPPVCRACGYTAADASEKICPVTVDKDGVVRKEDGTAVPADPEKILRGLADIEAGRTRLFKDIISERHAADASGEVRP